MKNIFLVLFSIRQIYLPANPISFELSKFIIKGESFPALDSVADFLLKHPAIRIEIDAHTDCRGRDDGSMAMMSTNRAEAVRDYLVSKGVDKNRIVSNGYGEHKPFVLENGQKLSCGYINSLSTKEAQEEAHAKNRRVEFVIVEL